MSPAGGAVPAALRLLGALTLELLLLRCAHVARGDCPLPPHVPNSAPDLENLTTFPVGVTIEYKCLPGFSRLPDSLNAVICLPSNRWTDIEILCDRSCGLPPRVLFASKKKIYIPVSFYPPGFIVEYDCILGFERNDSLVGKALCLQNYSWTQPEVFCYRRSCPKPKDIKNGVVSTPTGILFAEFIYFSCNPGYQLVGGNSTYCFYEGDNMVWVDPFPECHEIPTTPHTTTTQKPTTVGVPSTHAPSKTQKPTTVSVPVTKAPSKPQKPTTVSVPVTKAPSKPQKPTTVSVPVTKAPSKPQKPTTVSVPVTKAPSKPQKPTVKFPATEAPSTPEKTTTVNIPGTEAPPTPPKLTTVNVSSTEAPTTPQKPTTVNVSSTEAPTTPQKPTTVNVSSTEAPTTHQKPTTVNVSSTEAPTTPQKPTTVNVLAIATSTLQKLTTTNSSASKALLIPQKPSLDAPAMEAPPTSQKPITANDSPTIAKTSPVSNALSTETRPVAQTPIMTNSSATSKTQRLTTAKDSFTQNLSVTQKFTAAHVSVTKGVHIAQRMTSAHITATQSQAGSRTHFTTKKSGTLSKGTIAVASGIFGGALLVGILTLVRIIRDCRKSGSYYPHENNKALNAMFHDLTDTGDASEV